MVELTEQQIVRGIQLRLVAARFADGELTVVLETSSGSPNSAELAMDRSELQVDGRDAVTPSASSGTVGLSPGDDAQIEVVFPVEERPASFDLLVPRPYAVADDWQFDDVSLGENRTATRPGPLLLRQRATHPQGTQLELGAFSFTESRIGLAVVVRNAGRHGVVLMIDDRTHVEDDLGNRYVSVPPTDRSMIDVPAGSEVRGTISFAGAIDPEATSLSLEVNTGMGGSLDSSGTTQPAFRIDDLAIEPSGTPERPDEGIPEPLTVGDVRDHPSGVSATLQQVTFDETSLRASVDFVNPNAHEVQVQPSVALVDTVVVDDVGNEHELVTGEGDDLVVEIPPHSTTSADLVFSGRIADEADSIRVALNEGTVGAATHRTTLTPTFVWEQLTLPERTGSTWDLDLESLVTPARTELRSEALDRSAATVVAETVEQLDGSRTDDGVVLVVPDRVLFDFGSDALRADARARLADLAGVLEYFAGASVQVVGHTDSVGSAESNQALSERRASAVVDALVQLGIARDRLAASGRGEEEPTAANTTPDGADNPDGRQQNRRVEIIIETDEPIPTAP